MKVEYNKEHMAKSIGRSMSISTKFSIEICDQIRNKKVSRAKTILQDAIALKKAIPLRKFNKDIAHKTKIGPGKFTPKACAEILSLVESAEANAQFKGLNTSNLIIILAIANRAAKQWHYGRKRRRKMKRTHVEIIVAEGKDSKKSKTEDKSQKPRGSGGLEAKPQSKPSPKKEETTKVKQVVEKKETKPKQEKKPVVEKSQSKDKPKLSSENEKGLEKTKTSQKETKPSKEDKK